MSTSGFRVALPSTPRRRVARALGALLPVLSLACGQGSPSEVLPASPGGVGQTHAFLQSWGNELDVLFMIDNSSSMAPLQTAMLGKISSFVDQLADVPGGLPDIHLGVVSSDRGAGRFVVPGCSRVGGDQGALQSTSRNPPGCAGPSDPYLRRSQDSASGQTVANFTGEITDAFTCIAALGQGGCGFESQFGAVEAALGPSAPAVNQGFLRPEASLMVVLVTNEDDCTVPQDSDLFDPNMTDPARDIYGALQSYRCTEFGIVCDQPLPHLAPSAPVVLTGCHSKEDGRLERVSDFVTFLKSLKADPTKVFLTAIAAEPTSVTISSNLLGGTSAPVLVHVQPDIAADPAVRIKEAVTAFGDRGSFQSISADDWAPPLARLGRVAASAMGATCLPGKVQTATDGSPSCRLVDHAADGTSRDIPSCAANGGVLPCWQIEADDACASAMKVVVNRPGGAGSPAGTETKLSCDICVAGADSPGCR